MDSKIIKYLIIFLFISFKAYALEFNGKFIQGHFIIGKTDPGTKILIDKKNIKVSKEGFFVFGLDRDRKFDVTISVTNSNSKPIFVICCISCVTT